MSGRVPRRDIQGWKVQVRGSTWPGTEPQATVAVTSSRLLVVVSWPAAMTKTDDPASPPLPMPWSPLLCPRGLHHHRPGCRQARCRCSGCRSQWRYLRYRCQNPIREIRAVSASRAPGPAAGELARTADTVTTSGWRRLTRGNPAGAHPASRISRVGDRRPPASP